MDFHNIAQIFMHTAQAAEEAANAEASSGGVAGTLGINWKLFVAQLINFGIILGVLWKFVFIPVAKKLGERTDKIEKSLRDAQNIEVQKQQFETWKNQEMAKARLQTSEIVTASQNEAAKLKTQSLEQTRQEQQKMIEQAKQQILSEKDKALASAKTELADMVTQAAEKILKKKIDDKADKELIKENLASIK